MNQLEMIKAILYPLDDIRFDRVEPIATRIISDLFQKGYKIVECHYPYLSPKEVAAADSFLNNHKDVVNRASEVDKKFPPTDFEDTKDPSLWKPEHWRWFIIEKHSGSFINT